MKKYIIVLAMSGLFAVGASAQNASLLNTFSDPASAALGGATAALDADEYAVNNNPAAMSFYDGKFQLGAAYCSWAPDIAAYKASTAAGFFKAGKFAVGAAYRFFHEPEITHYSDVGAPMVTKTYPIDMTFTVGASLALGEKYSVGVSAKVISSKTTRDATFTECGVDVMGMFKSGGLSAAAGVCNLGSQAGSAKIGVAYGIAGITATADGQLFFNGGYMASVGAQYCIAGIVTPRVGYHIGKGDWAVGSFFSAGLGVNVWKFRLNGSYFFGGPLGNTFSAGLSICF